MHIFRIGDIGGDHQRIAADLPYLAGDFFQQCRAPGSHNDVNAQLPEGQRRTTAKSA
jgi:hypothetical protein